MYRARAIAGVARAALRDFPALVLTGPRQAGKTTFLREELGPDLGYASLDDPITSDLARVDPVGFLDDLSPGPVILDEIQNVPELLPHFKQRIDARRDVAGRWILS